MRDGSSSKERGLVRGGSYDQGLGLVRVGDDGDGKPPCRSHGGATIHDQTGRVSIGLDYLEFTLPFELKDRFLDGLPGGHELIRNKRGEIIGWRGYSHSAFIAQGKGRVGWSPGDDRMGFHVSLGSQALGVLAGLDDAWSDHPNLVGWILDDLGGHLTRIDVAFDDKTGMLDLDTMIDAAAVGEYVSRWREWQRLTSGKTVDGDIVIGSSLYMGSKKSDSQMRAYDKRSERLQKGRADQVAGVDHWVRVEVQFRRDRANAIGNIFKKAKTMARETAEKLSGVLRGLVEFKEPSNDTNKQRQPAAGWWVAFLGGAEKATLAPVVKDVRTVADVMLWISQQVGPSLALVEEGLGKTAAWAWLLDTSQESRSRWTARHRSILAASGEGG